MHYTSKMHQLNYCAATKVLLENAHLSDINMWHKKQKSGPRPNSTSFQASKIWILNSMTFQDLYAPWYRTVICQMVFSSKKYTMQRNSERYL